MPPSTVDDLRKLCANNQAYAQDASIIGTEESPATIDFDLSNFNLKRSRFKHVVFTINSNLDAVDFSGATLDSVSLNCAQRCAISSLNGATATAIRFSADSNLRGCSFTSATLVNIQFGERTNLEEANFSEARITQLSIGPRSTLENANFDNATLNQFVVDESANHRGAKYRFATFGAGCKLEFDRNYLANAVHHAERGDKWFSIANQFSGIWQIIYVALAGVFLGSILLKLYVFQAVSNAVSKFQIRFASELSAGPVLRAWDVLLGQDLLTQITFISALIFQAFRLYLTTKIGPMIDAERMTGYTPRRTDYEKLSWMVALVKLLGLSVFLLIAVELARIFVLEIRLPLELVSLLSAK